MKDISAVLRNITLVGQLGLSLACPLLICLFICYLLTAKLSAPMWIYVPGFILGIGSSAMTFYKFYTAVTNKEKKKSKKRNGISFNEHR